MGLRQRKSTGKIGDVKGTGQKECLYGEAAKKEWIGILETRVRGEMFIR